MRRLIAAHAREYPDGDWRPFNDIPYDREVSSLQRDWLPCIFDQDPPATVPIAGLWFGLFNPVRDKNGQSEEVTDMYVAGALTFDLDAESLWAFRPAYFPEGRYAHSEVLADIHRASYGSPEGLGVTAEQYLCLGYISFALKFLLADVDLSHVVRSHDSVGVAVGWDSGDPMYVGFVTQDGFTIRDPLQAIAGIQRRQEAFDRRLREIYGDRS
jgi:hypothetical protein